MNAFHPALVGVLYGALAQHEQALIQMELAANAAQVDVDAEAAERYAAVIDGLKRMIKAAEPSGYDASTFGVTEEMRRKHALLGDILSQLADFKVGFCSLSPHYGQGIQINMPLTHKSPELDPRAAIREIAHRLDLQYGERRHGSSATTLHIDATGKIQDVDVEIYELITAEYPFCDTHNVMIDADGVCPQCQVAGPDAAASPAEPGTVDVAEYDPGDPDYEIGTEAGNCPGCDGWHRPPWCADLSEPSEPEAIHAAMSDGAELPRCGAEYGAPIAMFLADVTCAPCKTRLAAVFAEENGRDDLTESTSTEPPGDAP